MLMRILAGFAVTTLLVMLSTAASADDWRDCTNVYSPDLGIPSCTRIINSGRESTKKLAYAYSKRATAYYMRCFPRCDQKGNADLDHAIADYEKAIELDPDNGPYGQRATAYFDKGDFDRAIADWDEAIELDSDALASLRAVRYRGRGEAYLAKGAFDRAIADFNIAVQLEPLFDVSYQNRGSAYLAKGDFDHAIADYDKAIKLLPANVVSYNLRGSAYLARGDFDHAIADWGKAIQIKPTYAKSYFNRANANYDKGNLAQALVDYNVSVSLSRKEDAWNTNALGRIAEIKRTLAVVPGLTPAQPSEAEDSDRHKFSVGDGAIIKVSSLENSGQEVILITVEGELKPDDNKSFTRAAIDAEFAVVALSSPGGDLRAGIKIGETIRIKEFATLVLKDSSCTSACALAWLAGQPRYMAPGARVGFHAPRRADNPSNQSDPAGSALVGAYLNKLALPSRAIAYFTETPPAALQWLTFEDADRLGIYVKEFR